MTALWRRAAAAADSDRPGRLGWSYIVACGLVAAAAIVVILVLAPALVA